MADRVVNTGFDTEFSGPLKKFRDYLRSQGIETNIISGVRSEEDQRQLVANRDATRAGRPLPYPDRGPVHVAAPVGSSAHEYGEAADLQPVNPADARRMHALAQQFGLQMPNWGGVDPYHVQLANWQQAAATQPPITAWDQTNPANVPTRMAMNMESDAPVSHQPANLLNRGTGSQAPIASQQAGNESHEAFIRDYAQKIGINPDLAVGIANAEGLRAWSASNPNAGSYIDRTAGVPWSFGDFQLNTRNGMGVDALKAGIDPRDPKQWQAADRFALDQMKSGGLAPWKGDSFAANWMKSGRPITGAGSAVASAAEPGIGSGIPTPAQPNAAATAAETPGPQNAGDWFKKLAARPPPTKDAQGNEVQGKSPLENIANSFKPAGGQQQAAAPQPAQFAPPQDPMAQLAGPSSQMFQAVSQAASRPLSWTSTPYGSMAGQQYGMPGTTLNSRGDYYG